MATGVYKTKKKDGTTYYRSSITYCGTHISLGSFPSFSDANNCYKEAKTILNNPFYTLHNHHKNHYISFKKYVSLINYRDNHIYFPTPIYVYQRYFSYYLSLDIELKFDMEDLFYYANKQIMKRNGHLFVSDYGMQINIASRYGIKNYAILNKDYTFINNDTYDFRYANIQIYNSYHGVKKIQKNNSILYQAKIHIRGYRIIGYYQTNIEAAIAYNKTIDILSKKGIKKKYAQNYIEEISNKEYADIYSKLKISSRILQL